MDTGSLPIAVDLLPMLALDAPALEAMAASLDNEEQIRAGRFRFECHRREFVAAHGLKRRMLSEAMPDVLPKAWRFQATSTGKPEVLDWPGLRFSLTHCDGLVACAVAWGVSVGLDAESVHRDVPRELIEHHFSPAEREWLAGRPESEIADGFFGLWTLKEAWVKATGLGLSLPLQQASFELADPPRVRFEGRIDDGIEPWRFRQWRLDTHVTALGWCGPPREIRCRVIQTWPVAWRTPPADR